MTFKIGKLYLINNGYWSDLPDEMLRIGGAYATDMSNERWFHHEGTIALMLETGYTTCKVLIGDQIYTIDARYLQPSEVPNS